MSTVELTSQDLESTISNNEVVVIDFWADWCPPCRMFGPIFEAASERHPDLVFGKVNTMQQPDLAHRFNVRTIPTVMIFRDQVLVHNRAGALSPAKLDDLVDRCRNLDMDDVRDAILADRQAAG